MVMLSLVGSVAVGPPLQTDVCTLAQPVGCVGQVVELVLVDGSQVSGMVTQIANTGADRAIQLSIPDGGLTLVNLNMVRELHVGAAGIGLAAVDMLLLAVIGVLLLALVTLVVTRRRGRVVTPAADRATPEALPPVDDTTLAGLALPGDLQSRRVDPASVDVPLVEKTYATIGAGLGSLAWVQALRTAGVTTADIVVIGTSDRPYTGYRLRCHRSQLFDHDRIRSDSGSTPDNLWGWPGYAVREAGRHLRHGRIMAVLGVLWQVLAEPVLAETYTPQAGDVYRSIDHECRRIGWSEMFWPGQVRCIRQTTDGRYLLLYAAPGDAGAWEQRGLIVRYLHLATGSTRARILPEVQDFRQQHPDDHRVTHVYEAHDMIYERLAANGGTVLLRGRGIAAAQILKRLAELREVNKRIRIVHIMRWPNPAGRRHGRVRRSARAHWELQIYNWPRSAFGGGWHERLRHADDDHRAYLLATLGEPTVPPRRDWLRHVENGRREGWYQQYIGSAQRIDGDDERLYIQLDDATFDVDYVIDATGLAVDFSADPLLNDLCETYDLPLNHQDRLTVTDDFELAALRQESGRVFAAGLITFGNHYAPVDSFIGLQYAALRSVDALAGLGAPGVRRISGLRALVQWWRWTRGVKP